MASHIRCLTLGLCLLLLFILSGCGGTTPQTTVQVSPLGVELGASETQQFTATVTNAPATAVTWSITDCTGDACGTISQTGLYTAPSLIPDTVSVTIMATLATNPNIRGKAKVNQTPLSVTVSPEQPLYLGAKATQVFTASITKHPNADVDWNLSGTGCAGDVCGTLTNVTTSSATYNAPATVANEAMVTINVTSMADSTKSKSVIVNLKPVAVAVSPGPMAMAAPSGTRNFRAMVQYDPENAGVTWGLAGAGCSGESCGSLTNVTSSSVVYNAPATSPDPPTVTLTASSITDNAQSAVSSITISSEISALQGKYAFLIRGYRRESGAVTMETMAGHFDADGNGDLAGVWDANRGPDPQQGQAIIGSYAIQADGRGNLTIESGTQFLTFHLAIDETGATARLAEDTRSEAMATQPSPWNDPPDARGSSGILVRQDPASFSLSSVNGDRVIALSGEHTGSSLAALGRFTSDPTGNLSEGVADLTWMANWLKFTNRVELSGSFSAPSSSTGRGTAALTTGGGVFNFAYYIVSNRDILLVQTDPRGSNMPTLSGEVKFQNGAGTFTNASLNAPVVFNLSGTIGLGDPSDPLDSMFGYPYPAIFAGHILPNGSGWFALNIDQNEAGTVALDSTSSGDYTVAPNGRVSLAGRVAYLTDLNSGYLIAEGWQGAHFGSFEPQAGGPFDLQSMSGTFRFNTGLPTTLESLNASGLLKLAEDGTVVATLSGAIGSFDGKLDLSSNGRGTLTLASSSGATPAHIVIWTVSPDRAIALVKPDSDCIRPALMHLERLK